MPPPIPYSKEVQDLCRHYGFTLAARSCAGGWLWDGQTQACFYQDWMDLDDLNDLPRLPWKIIPACGTLHDLAHFVVAEEWCRDLPEWGLGTVDTQFGANGGYHLLTSKQQEAASMSPENPFQLIPTKTSDQQEHLAYLMGLWFCWKAGEKLVERTTSPDWIPAYDPGHTRAWVPAELIKKYSVPADELVETIRHFRRPTRLIGRIFRFGKWMIY